MKDCGFTTQLQAIVTGSSCDGFVVGVVKLFEEFEIEFVNCTDIYRTVSWLVKNKPSNVLIVGRYEQLSREAGRFFQIASRNGCKCCCLMGSGSVRDKHTSSPIEADMEVVIVDKLFELEEIIAELCTSDTDDLSSNRNGIVSDFNVNDFRTTTDELNALLGV